ncbi:CDP-diacylglycerol--glycerol-3-phosphate 3-phosphatidyltransferase [Thermovibrio sp.]
MGRVKSLPNFLTLLRVFLIPFVVLAIFLEHFKEAFFLFALCGLTDFLDGYIARKRNSITSLGILLDPIADKLLTSSTLISLAYVKACDLFSVLVIVGREEAVTGMRAIAASRGIVIPASKGGKLKTFLIMVSVSLILLGFKRAGELLLVFSAFVALYTGFVYFYNFFKELREI